MWRKLAQNLSQQQNKTNTQQQKKQQNKTQKNTRQKKTQQTKGKTNAKQRDKLTEGGKERERILKLNFPHSSVGAEPLINIFQRFLHLVDTCDCDLRESRPPSPLYAKLADVAKLPAGSREV